jgi:hypothetical protein
LHGEIGWEYGNSIDWRPNRNHSRSRSDGDDDDDITMDPDCVDWVASPPL